jgi:hypothetical protein
MLKHQADNIAIFQSCLLQKMRLSVVLEGINTDYQNLWVPQITVQKFSWCQASNASPATEFEDLTFF